MFYVFPHLLQSICPVQPCFIVNSSTISSLILLSPTETISFAAKVTSQNTTDNKQSAGVVETVK